MNNILANNIGATERKQMRFIKTLKECAEKILDNIVGVNKVTDTTKYIYTSRNNNVSYYMIYYKEANKLQIYESSNTHNRVMTAYEFMPTSINIIKLDNDKYTHKAIFNLVSIVVNGEIVDINSHNYPLAIKKVNNTLKIEELNKNLLNKFS